VFNRGVDITMRTPGVDALGEAVAALRDWQHEGAPMQLHPGDLGWFQRFGAEATAAAVRTWSSDGRMLAVGLLDGDDLLRLTLAPNAFAADELAVRIADDVDDPDRGVFAAGSASLELPTGALLDGVLADRGWAVDEPWTPLRRDLSDPVEDVALRIEVTTSATADIRASVHRAAFDRSIFTEDRWNAMAGGPAFADARCLIGWDDQGTAVAGITVWSAGVGRPGLIEPMGVHRDHRGHGYGTAISIAGAAALRELGSSSAVVATPSSNVGGIATYRAAGYEPLRERFDRRRDA
jgi:GNAT superfamily N-acetyltransferase